MKSTVVNNLKKLGLVAPIALAAGAFSPVASAGFSAIDQPFARDFFVGLGLSQTGAEELKDLTNTDSLGKNLFVGANLFHHDNLVGGLVGDLQVGNDTLLGLGGYLAYNNNAGLKLGALVKYQHAVGGGEAVVKAKADAEAAQKAADEAEAQLAKTQAAVDAAQRALDEAKAKADEAEAQLAKAQSDAEAARKAADEAKAKVDENRAEGFNPPSVNLDQAKGVAEVAQKAADEAKYQADKAAVAYEAIADQVKAAEDDLTRARAEGAPAPVIQHCQAVIDELRPKLVEAEGASHRAKARADSLAKLADSLQQQADAIEAANEYEAAQKALNEAQAAAEAAQEAAADAAKAQAEAQTAADAAQADAQVKAEAAQKSLDEATAKAEVPKANAAKAQAAADAAKAQLAQAQAAADASKHVLLATLSESYTIDLPAIGSHPVKLTQFAHLNAQKPLIKEKALKDDITANFKGGLALSTVIGQFSPSLSVLATKAFDKTKEVEFGIAAGLGYQVTENVKLQLGLNKKLKADDKSFNADLGVGLLF